MIRFVPLLILLLAVNAGAQSFSAIPRTTNVVGSDLMLVETNSAGSAGQRFVRSITLQNVFNSLTNIGQITMGSELFVDAGSGNDNTGTRGRPDKPFATLVAAKTAAHAGDTIVVYPGTYTRVTNLWFNGTWFFHNPLLRLIDIPTNTSGAGLFDDRFSGAVTCNVMGSLSIEYHSGTNVIVSPVDCTFSYNTNALGPIVQTNPATYIRWNAETKLGLCGGNPTPFAITTLHGVSNSYYRNFEIYNLNPSNLAIITTNCPADPGTVYTMGTGCAGVHWGDIDVIIEADIRPMTLQAVWGDNLTTNANQLWISGTVCDGKWYMVGRTNQWKLWADYDEYKGTAMTIGDLFDLWNTGSYYFKGKKASSKLGTVVNMLNPDHQKDTNLIAWFEIDKLSGSNSWANIQHGEFRGRIGHFDQNGPNAGTPMITISNISALANISGERMAAANTVIAHGGGVASFHDYNIISTNRDPVHVLSAGLDLDVASISTINGTNSVRAGSAQTVTLGRGFSGPAVHANVTLSGTNQMAWVNAAGGATFAAPININSTSRQTGVATNTAGVFVEGSGTTGLYSFNAARTGYLGMTYPGAGFTSSDGFYSFINGGTALEMARFSTNSSLVVSNWDVSGTNSVRWLRVADNGTIANNLTVGSFSRPLFSATNYGTVLDDGTWDLLLNEEWIANPISVAGAVGNHPWTTATTGTLPVGLGTPLAESNVWSAISMITTQTTSGRILACPTTGAGVPTGFVLTNCEYFLEARIRMNSTNLTGDVSTTRVGLGANGVATGEQTDGVYIMNNTNVNTNTFILVTTRGGARTFNYSTLGTYGNQTWQTVGLYLDRTGTNAIAFVGADRFRLTSFATNNANMIGDSIIVGCFIQNERMASTGGLNFRTNQCDYIKLWVHRFL